MKSFSNNVQGRWIIAAIAATLLTAGCAGKGSKADDKAMDSAKAGDTAKASDTAKSSDTAKASGSAMSTPAMNLSGTQEVPPSGSPASGVSSIVIGADKSVMGSIQVSGMVPTAAHIHEAPKGANGPVIVPMTKTSDTVFAIPPGAKLTDSQYASYMAGNLYVNVHSATFPGGEIRAQLMPK